MYAKLALVATLLAGVEARFNQEGLVQSTISALGEFGQPGQAATLAGQSPGVLLAGANACAKLTLADLIVTQLGTDPKVISAAIALVAAEKNFNPFAQSIPTICSDATLPKTEALRGIVPLVDPAVTGSNTENANSASSKTNPFQASGLSVAEVVIANGFSNFTLQGSDGSTSAASGGAAAVVSAAPAAATSASVTCTPPVTITTIVTASAAAATETAAVVSGVQQSTITGLDFGLCVPTIKFEGGLGGRKATEFTFQAIDALVAKGQQEALNPNIITNRICDQLTNVCEANQAAKDACLSAKAAILALNTRNADTANKWNSLLGFAGTNITPDA